MEQTAIFGPFFATMLLTLAGAVVHGGAHSPGMGRAHPVSGPSGYGAMPSAA
jgi:hypothetical protein